MRGLLRPVSSCLAHREKLLTALRSRPPRNPAYEQGTRNRVFTMYIGEWYIRVQAQLSCQKGSCAVEVLPWDLVAFNAVLTSSLVDVHVCCG